MKFINVSSENMKVVKKTVRGFGWQHYQMRGYYLDINGSYIRKDQDSFVVEGGCCWGCHGTVLVDDIVGQFILTEEQYVKFWDWFSEMDDDYDYRSDLTWDFALNVGTDYKKEK